MNTPELPPQPRNPAPAPPPGLTFADVCFVLFRHKWKILIVFALGLLSAAAYAWQNKLMYRSTAALLVRYVMDRRSVDAAGQGSQVRSPDSRGDDIINSEVSILTSFDVAKQVANQVGPGEILRPFGGGTNQAAAAAFIVNHLTVATPKHSDVIQVSFDHPNPTLSVQVLSKLIDAYLEKHLQIHSAAGAFDFLQQQTDDLRSKLDDTEARLNDLKKQAGIVSLADSKKQISDEMQRLQTTLLSAQADLAEQRAKLDEMAKALPAAAATERTTNNTNQPQKGKKETTDHPLPQPSTLNPQPSSATASADAQDLASLNQTLATLRRDELRLTSEFTPQSIPVRQIRLQIAAAEKQRDELLKRLPPATSPAAVLAAASPRQSLDPDAVANAQAGVQLKLNLLNERANIAALQAKIQALTEELNRVHARDTNVDNVATSIRILERTRDLQETNFRYFSSSLEQARIDSALATADKTPNINIIQAPCPPMRDLKPLAKTLALLVFGSLAAAIALAFLIDFWLDTSLKRPDEVERKLGLPVILTVPELELNANNGNRRRLLRGPGPGGKNGNGEELVPARIAPWDDAHGLRAYYEALRDRMVMLLEGVNRRPKFIGVAGPRHGAGTTTLAVGLAATLSETGEGKVLLVDLNLPHGAAHPFFHGKPACEVDDAAVQQQQDAAQVQQNLYLASAGSANGDPHPARLKKFTADLLPRLKASDYDYVILDMPTITQTSVTPRLAGLMDSMLVVMESEKVGLAGAQQAKRLLSLGRAKVHVVFNRTKKHVPARISGEA